MKSVPPVITRPERQGRQVDRLVSFCKELDGTEVDVIPISKEEDDAFLKTCLSNHFANLQASGLRKAARKYQGSPFIWLEPDAVPLKKGWVQALSKEYAKAGNPYMLSSDEHPPHDMVGGIGIYGPDTAVEIPMHFPTAGWDLWMYYNMRPFTHWTPLIQHSYGIYGPSGQCSCHVFPRDAGILREDAVIFHRDKHQTLSRKNTRFFHSGDLGDIVAALPVIRELGGGDLIIGNRPQTRPIAGARFESIKPLLAAQPYLRSVEYNEAPEGIDFDFSNFREKHTTGANLLTSQASWFGLEDVSLEPWLEVKPSEETKGKVVFARSARYHNSDILWMRVAEQYGRRALFVGLPEEHRDFERRVRTKVAYRPVRDFLELAELIAGADLFVGNQSSPCWVAMGLGVNLIQETKTNLTDSIIPRPNAQFCRADRFNPSHWQTLTR